MLCDKRKSITLNSLYDFVLVSEKIYSKIIPKKKNQKTKEEYKKNRIKIQGP